MLLYMFEDSADHDHKLLVDRKAIPEPAKALCKKSGEWRFQRQLEDVSENDSLFIIGPVAKIAADIKKQGYHEAQIIWEVSTNISAKRR